MPGVKIIEAWACSETIGYNAFSSCSSLRRLIVPSSVRIIEERAFSECIALTDADLPKGLEMMGEVAFAACASFRRIVIPLKDNMIGYNLFDECVTLLRVELVGGVHKTFASLHLRRWRHEMREEN